MEKKFTNLIVALAAAHVVGNATADEHREPHGHSPFPKDVEAFHSVLAPLWHARPGKERSRNACAKASEMESVAKDIRSGDAAPLVAAVVALEKDCRDREADIDAALFEVHEAFHRLAEPGHAR